MGMELQYAVNLLASLPKNTNHVAVSSSDCWEFFHKRLLKSTERAGLQGSMDRLFEQCNRESLRKTMLMHEQIFKEQVRELHRLYTVQKMLMDELGKKELKLHQLVRSTRGGTNLTDTGNRSGFWSPGKGPQSGTANSAQNLQQLYSVRADPSSQERSSSCTGDDLRIRRCFDLERPAEEDFSTDVSAIEDQMGPSFRRPSKDKMSIDSSHDPQLYTDVESELELTLSIGCGSSKRKSRNCHPHKSVELGCSESTHDETRQLNPSTLMRSGQEEECSDPNTTGTAPATFKREGLQQSPWPFQSLSLNRP